MALRPAVFLRAQEGSRRQLHGRLLDWGTVLWQTWEAVLPQASSRWRTRARAQGLVGRQTRLVGPAPAQHSTRSCPSPGPMWSRLQHVLAMPFEGLCTHCLRAATPGPEPSVLSALWPQAELPVRPGLVPPAGVWAVVGVAPPVGSAACTEAQFSPPNTAPRATQEEQKFGMPV